MRVNQPRAWTIGEEVAHSVTHGLGLLAAIAGLVILLLQAATTRDPWRITACAIYASTLVLLYGASTLYHALSATRARRVLRVLDHSAIFLLIAGTYTPFALVSLRGPWGWTLLGIVWGLALLGIIAKAVFGARWPVVSTALYVCMGWVVLVAARPLAANVPAGAIAWLVAGGVAYTAGIVFYAWTRLRYSHAVWHLFVMAGSACHFVAVARYVV